MVQRYKKILERLNLFKKKYSKVFNLCSRLKPCPVRSRRFACLLGTIGNLTHSEDIYLPMDFVTMRTGGVSTRNVKSRLQLIKDDVRGCRENGIYTNPLMISVKFLYKIFELKI